MAHTDLHSSFLVSALSFRQTGRHWPSHESDVSGLAAITRASSSSRMHAVQPLVAQRQRSLLDSNHCAMTFLKISSEFVSGSVRRTNDRQGGLAQRAHSCFMLALQRPPYHPH